MDTVFGYLLSELEKINKLKDLNIITLSDHGMAELAKDQFVFIKDYVDPNLINFNKSVFSIVSSIYSKSEDKVNISFFFLYLNISSKLFFLVEWTFWENEKYSKS